MTNRVLNFLYLVSLSSILLAETRVYFIKDSLKYCICEEDSLATIMAVGDSVRLPVTEDSTLVIPASVNVEGHTYEVEAIEGDAFCGHPEIKHLVINEGIRYIQEKAFCRCVNLHSIRLPSSLCVLSATSFAFCSRLMEITVDRGNETFDSRNHCNAVISIVDSTLVLGCRATQIPGDVTAIGPCAFEGQLYLDSLTVPEGVKRMEGGALRNCAGLRCLSLPESLEVIGDLVFDGCSNLCELYIPACVREIGHSVLSGCTGLRKITVAPGNRWFDSRECCNAIIRTSEDSIVAGCGQSTIIEGIRRIGDSAFWSTSLSKIYIPRSVMHIAERAFINSRFCSSIEVAWGNPVYDSRGDCNAIIETATGTLVKGCCMTTFPFGVSRIGGHAFQGMPMPDGLIVPEGIVSIGTAAFANCDMHALTLPTSLRRIEDSAFAFCPRLEIVETDSPELYIGRAAFHFCYSLLSVRLPRYTTYANSEVFQYTPYQKIHEWEDGKP